MRRFPIGLFVGGWLLAIAAACGCQPGGSGDSMPTAVAAQQTLLAGQTVAAKSPTPWPSPKLTEAAKSPAPRPSPKLTEAATASAVLPSEVPPPTGTEPPLATPRPLPTEPGRAIEPSPLVTRNLAGNLLWNGAFEDLAGWGTLHQSNVADQYRLETGDNYVLWERTRSHSDAGAVGVFQDLQADVLGAEQVQLCLDVWVGYHTLGNTGSWSDEKGGVGEMPVHIVVHYLDASGNHQRWSYGFLIEDTGERTVHNYTKVRPATWLRICFDLMDDELRKDFSGDQILPPPAMITQVRLFGNGWDFKGAVGNALLEVK